MDDFKKLSKRMYYKRRQLERTQNPVFAEQLRKEIDEVIAQRALIPRPPRTRRKKEKVFPIYVNDMADVNRHVSTAYTYVRIDGSTSGHPTWAATRSTQLGGETYHTMAKKKPRIYE